MNTVRDMMHVGHSDREPCVGLGRESVASEEVVDAVEDVTVNNEACLYITGMSGFTQSDSSLGSYGAHNPTYAYGNQCEYQGCGSDYEVVPQQSWPCDDVFSYGDGDVSTNDTQTIQSENVIPETAQNEPVFTCPTADTRCITADIDNGNVSSTTLQNNDPGGYDVDTSVTYDVDTSVTSIDNLSSADHENNLQVGNTTVHSAFQDDVDRSALECIRTPRRRRLTSSLKGRSRATPYKRKSVTFSLDLDDARKADDFARDVDGDESELEDEVYEEDDVMNKANNKRDWFEKQRSYCAGSRQEKTFLLGPEFEGVEPTYV